VTDSALPSGPKGPVFGETDVMVGGCSTVNGTLLLETLPTSTVTEPLVAFCGTMAVRLLPLVFGLPGTAMPLNSTWVVKPAVAKPEPFTVMVAPTAPDGGERLLMAGFVTVKTTFVLLGTEFSTTVTGPVLTLLGDTAWITESLQLVT